MKNSGILIRLLTAASSFLALACVLAAAGAVCFCRGRLPVLAQVPEEAACQVETLMEAVCSGDFQQAQSLIYGTPELGGSDPMADPVAAMLWEAYVESLDYVLVGEVYPSDQGMVQDVKLIHLELGTLTEQLGERAGALLQKAVDEAESVSDLYDDQNVYRKDLVDRVMLEAARQALAEDVRYTYEILPLQMICQDGQWWIVADSVFLKALTGGMAG